MSKLDDLIKKLCPNGVEYKKLYEVTIWDKKFKGVEREKQPKTINYSYLLANDLFSIKNDNGNVYLLSTGKVDGWTTEELAGINLCEGEIVSIPWGGTPIVKYYKGKFVTSDNRIATSNNINVLNNKYLYYYLKNKQTTLNSFYRGSSIKHPDMYKVLHLQIPIPPLEVQEEIVRILDTFTELNKELNKELECRKKQYVYYRDLLLSDDVLLKLTNKYSNSSILEYKKLGDVCETITDYTAAGSFANIKKNVKYIKNNIGYAQLIRTTDLKSKFENKNDFVFINENAFNYLWRVNLNSEGLILPNVGNCGEIYYITPNMLIHKNNVLGPNAIWLKSNTVNNKYLYYIFLAKDFQKKLNKITTKVGQTKFNKTNLKEIQIPIPPLEVQEKIVEILDNFTELTESITDGLPAEIDNRNKQYTYYRDKLLSF